MFTSLRTPTGEGYRIITASAGVRHDEKQEVVRRFPSHGALCDRAPDATALLAFELPTGRYCVGHVRYAGVEHTGRGGQRVHTHAALLDPADYALFECDATLVHSAFVAAIGSEPLLKPTPSLNRLTLPPPGMEDPIPALPGAHDTRGCFNGQSGDLGPDIAEVLSAAAVILDGGSALVASAHPHALLAWVIPLLPLRVRATISMSAGLQFSPSRQFRLCAIPPTAPTAVCAPDLCLVTSGRSIDPEKMKFSRWLDLLKRYMRQRRWREIRQLTNRPNLPVEPSQLDRIATVLEAVDRVGTADEATLTQMLCDHGEQADASELEQQLTSHLQAAIRARLESRKTAPRT
ncbi:MAG: hypothetical protein AMXMBFR13_18530 [Phycisphaerae bacterium]